LVSDHARQFAERFFAGLLDLADEFGVVIAGGDTNTWDGPLVANITLLGHPAGKAAVTRSGAKPGDKIFVTGELGDSIHGHHLTFTPRVREAQQLIELVDIHAMIDISDGLAADLHHILEASQVGAVLYADKIPCRSELQSALADGEDFELLFTVSAADAEKLERAWPGPTRLTCFGEITAVRECWLVDGEQKTPLPPLGWVHRL
jgi:thiamine-monophosphate kinase